MTHCPCCSNLLYLHRGVVTCQICGAQFQVEVEMLSPSTLTQEELARRRNRHT